MMQLTHKQVQSLVEGRESLSAEMQAAVETHLAHCHECQHFAAMITQLQRNTWNPYPKQNLTSTQKQVIVQQITRPVHKNSAQPPQPISRNRPLNAPIYSNRWAMATVVLLLLVGAFGFITQSRWQPLADSVSTVSMTNEHSPSLPDGLVIRAMDLDHDWGIVGPAMDDAYADHWGAIPDEIIDAVVQSQPVDEEVDEEPPEDESYSNGPGRCFIALDG